MTLALGASAAIIVQEDVPATALRGSTDSIDVRVASNFDPSATDVVVDATQIRAAGIRVDLAKSVSAATTTIGDVVTYTVTYSGVGAGTATALVITDVVPTGTTYVLGTMRVKGNSVTDAADVDGGDFDAANNAVVFHLGDVPAGQNGSVTFQARVNNVPAQYVITNIAKASYGTPIGADSSMSAPVWASLHSRAQLGLAYSLDAADSGADGSIAPSS